MITCVECNLANAAEMQIFPLVSVIAPVSSVYYAAKKYLGGRVAMQAQEPPPPSPKNIMELEDK
jgi:hypothetical protein